MSYPKDWCKKYKFFELVSICEKIADASSSSRSKRSIRSNIIINISRSSKRSS